MHPINIIITRNKSGNVQNNEHSITIEGRLSFLSNRGMLNSKEALCFVYHWLYNDPQHLRIIVLAPEQPHKGD